MNPAAASLDHVFRALADPTRRAILARLSQGEASVTELVAPFGLAQPTISKHLKVLEDAGLVSRGRQAQFRPVRLNAAPLAQAAQWLGQYSLCWEDSFDKLDALLCAAPQPSPKPPSKGQRHAARRSKP